MRTTTRGRLGFGSIGLMILRFICMTLPSARGPVIRTLYEAAARKATKIPENRPLFT
jgi:hypothetical protein